MRDDDNQFHNDRFDDNQPDDNNQPEASRAASRRTVCRHSFRTIGVKRVCRKCGLKVSTGKPS